MGRMDVVDEMLDCVKTNIIDQHDHSDIAKFYRGKSVFITGASGFIGKTLLEKLLRSCPHIDNIYILMRPKRGKEIAERVRELTESEIFNRIKGMKDGASCLKKIVPIRGDITQPRFGVSDEDVAIIANKVSLIFHSAATVKFQEPMKMAIEHNVISVRNLLDLTSELKALEALVHVSTAYSNCNRKEVEEIFYEPPIEPNRLIEMAGWMDSETLDRISPALIADRPNTYTYTKAVAESLLVTQVAKRFPNLPVAIVRPSIVTGAWREPITGWVDNYNGPTGVVLSMVTGLIQAMRAYPNFCADIVPVDIVSNLLICTAWYLVTSGHKSVAYMSKSCSLSDDTEQTQTDGNDADKQEEIVKHNCIEIFNCVSGSINPVTWREFANHTFTAALRYPCINFARIPGNHLISNYYVYRMFDFINHKCVAHILDFFMTIFGKKAKMMPIYNRMVRMVTTLTPFTTNQWVFDCSNVVKLYDQLHPVDKDLFNFNIQQLNWETYLGSYYVGAKLYVMKDDPKQLPKALMAQTRLKYINNAFAIMLIMILYYFCIHGSSFESRFFNSMIHLVEIML